MKRPPLPPDEHISLDGPPAKNIPINQYSGELSLEPEERAPLTATNEPLLQIVDPTLYERKLELGRGGLGRVLQATDRRLLRDVALKQLLPQKKKAQDRFLREALITAKLQHPSIVPVYEVGYWPSGEPFYTMKMVSGKPFHEMISAAKTLTERLALLPHVLAACDAMAYAHSKRIIHRDLKPHNILIGEFGETIVIDWGIAKQRSEDGGQTTDSKEKQRPPTTLETPQSNPSLSREETGEQDHPNTPISLVEGASEKAASSTEGQSLNASANLTMEGAVLGTPAYMPPEQAKGEPVDERADVYALGSILYHLLAGAAPYEGNHGKAILRQVLKGPPPSLEKRQPGVPKDLSDITEKAMAREAAKRYPSAKELAEDLKKFQTGKLVEAHHYSTWELFRRWINRHQVAVIVAALLSLVLALTVFFGFQKIRAEKLRAEDNQREAENQRAAAVALNNELLLKQARLFLEKNPSRALSWLKQLPKDYPKPGAIRTIAADALSRGVPITLRGDKGNVEQIAFSPDGKLLASSYEDRDILIWDVACETPPCHVPKVLTGHIDAVSSMRFSPDGKWLASGGAEPNIRLWDVSTGAARLLSGHTKAIQTLTFSSDGALLASASNDGTIRLWSVPSGESRALVTHENIIGDIAFSPDGKLLASLCWDNQARLFDVASGALLRSQKLVGGGDVEFSPDGQLIAVASDDGSVYLWSLLTDTLSALKGHANVVTRVRFSPDGVRLASASWDHTVRVWDLAERTSQVLFGHEQNVQHVEFSPNGKLLASAGQGEAIRLWDLTQKAAFLDRSRVLRGTESSVGAIAFSPDGRYLASTNNDELLRLWSVYPREGQALHEHQQAVMRVAFSPDGKLFATASTDKTIRLWSVGYPANPVQVLSGHSDGISDIAFTPDGKRLVSIGAMRDVFVWDVVSGQKRQLSYALGEKQLDEIPFNDLLSSDLARFVAVSLDISSDGRFLAFASKNKKIELYDLKQNTSTLLEGHKTAVTQLSFSPDGTKLASAGFDGEVYLWELSSGAHRAWVGHEGAVYALRFSPDGTRLASAGHDKTIRLWDIETGRGEVLKGHEEPVLDVAFSPDGASLASGSFDQRCLVWDLKTKKPTRLEGHKRRVFSVVFSPDGRRLATASFDGTVRLWDLASQEVRALLGHSDEVYHVAFSPDGRWLVSGSRDSMVYVWSDDLPEKPAALRAWLEGLFTPPLE